MQAISIGPLVFAGDRLAAVVGLGAFMIVTSILSPRHDSRMRRWSTWALITGLAAARLGHVIENASNFAAEPWRILSVWQGGFSWPWGVCGVAIVSMALVRTRRTGLGAVASLVVALFAWNVVRQSTNTTPSRPMPNIALERAGGGSAALTSFIGKPVVVNLWASWCPPCRREMPTLAEVAAARGDVTFLFVNQGETRTTIEAYLEREKLILSNVLVDSRMDVPRHYATPGLPVTLFIQSDGKLQSLHVGEISREALTSAITHLASK